LKEETMSVTAFRDTDVSSPTTPPALRPPAAVQVISREVTVTFTPDGVGGLWSAHADPVEITLPYNNVATILWTLVPPEGGADVQFDAPPITFPQDQSLAPMQIMDMPNAQQAIATWTNTTPIASGVIYRYFIHALVNGVQVTHDPRVQNDPPPPGP
jgi:hypothetical protein